MLVSLFLDGWMSIGAPPSTVDILRDGYSLPFLRPPPSVLPRLSDFTVLRRPDQVAVVDEEVDLEAAEVVETELATIATKKDTWQENAQKETAEIVRNSEET